MNNNAKGRMGFTSKITYVLAEFLLFLSSIKNIKKTIQNILINYHEYFTRLIHPLINPFL